MKTCADADLVYPREALCQNCLRIHLVTTLIPDDNDPPGRCPTCDGQTCSCDTCMADAADLRDGLFDEINVKPWLRVVAWTADDGATVIHIPTKLDRDRGYGRSSYRLAGYLPGRRGAPYVDSDKTIRRRKRPWCDPPRRFRGHDYWLYRFDPIPF